MPRVQFSRPLNTPLFKLLHVRDASGKEIEPTASPDTQIFIDRNNERAFLQLRPNHFVGTNLVADLKFLNITKPGKYSIAVEYFCKVPSNEVVVKPFWGRENGSIFSDLFMDRGCSIDLLDFH